MKKILILLIQGASNYSHAQSNEVTPLDIDEDLYALFYAKAYLYRLKKVIPL